MAGRFSIETAWKAVDRVSRPITRMGGRVTKTFRRMNASVQAFNTKMSKVRAKASSAFTAIAATAAIAGLAIKAVVMKGAEFEQSLVGAASRFKIPIKEGTAEWKKLTQAQRDSGDVFTTSIKKGTAEFKELNVAARAVGSTTEFTASQAAEGLNFLAKAGFSAQASMKLLPGIVDLATASELDLARASDIASDAIGAFGLMSDDPAKLAKNFARVSDAMSLAVNSSNMDMDTLFETIKTGAPAATAAGVSLEEFLAITGKLANIGLKGSTSGTALKNIFLKLADSAAQKKLKAVGVDVRNSAGELKGFAQILDELGEATKEGKRIDVAGFLNDVFGLRGVTGMAALLGEGTVGLKKLTAELQNAEGRTKLMADQLRDTRLGQIKTMESAWESLMLSLSAGNDTVIGEVIEGLTGIVRTIDGFVQANPVLTKWLGIMLLVVAAVATIGVVVAGLTIAFTTVAASAAAVWGFFIAIGVAAAVWVATLDPVQEMFASWMILLRPVLDGLSAVASFGGGVVSRVLGALGIGGDDESPADAAAKGAANAGVSSPEGREANQISETRSTSESVVTLKADQGTSISGTQGPLTGLKIQSSGGTA